MEKINKEDAYKNLERVNFWINNSDTKTSFLLAFVGILIGFSISNSKFIDSIETAILEIKKFFGTIPFDFKVFLSFLLVAGLAVFFVFLFLTIKNLLVVITAKVNPSEEEFEEKKVIKNSKIFFNTIAVNKGEYKDIPKNDFPMFLDTVNNLSEADIFKDINSQTYINSMICKRKYSYYNKGIWWLKRTLIVVLILIPIFLILSSL